MANCTICDDKGWYKEESAPVTRQCSCVASRQSFSTLSLEVVEGLEEALSIYDEHGLMGGEKGMAQLDAIFKGARAQLKFQQTMKVRN